MRTLGLLGGMSWESSATYYRILNERVRDALGPSHSAKCVLWSCDFAEMEELQNAGRWDEAGALLAAAAKGLEGAGAEAIVLCTNTMHCVAPAIEAAVGIPLLHIADAAGEAARAAGARRVGLLGTRFTMEGSFLRERLAARSGLEVLVPPADDRALVHEVIYRELIAGVVEAASRQRYREVLRRLVDRGAEAVVLGCTEIGLLVGAGDAPVPVLDTAALHAEAAVRWALAG